MIGCRLFRCRNLFGGWLFGGKFGSRIIQPTGICDQPINLSGNIGVQCSVFCGGQIVVQSVKARVVLRFFQIGIAVSINVADTFQMRKHRHPRLALHQPNQALATARHDHVNKLNRLQHRRHHLAVTRRHQLNRILGQPGLAQPPHHTGMDRF